MYTFAQINRYPHPVYLQPYIKFVNCLILKKIASSMHMYISYKFRYTIHTPIRKCLNCADKSAEVIISVRRKFVDFQNSPSKIVILCLRSGYQAICRGHPKTHENILPKTQKQFLHNRYIKITKLFYISTLCRTLSCNQNKMQ